MRYPELFRGGAGIIPIFSYYRIGSLGTCVSRDISPIVKSPTISLQITLEPVGTTGFMMTFFGYEHKGRQWRSQRMRTMLEKG